MKMVLNRIITHGELECARFPHVIVESVINEMRRHFYPVEDVVTRAFCLKNIKATCIEMSISE